MGKIRRERKKFHLSSNSAERHSPLNVTTNWSVPSQQQITNVMPQTNENIFAGIDIPLTSVSLREDDAVSVSTSKTVFKDRCATKKERRKLRHQTFIEKINAIQALKNMKQKKYKKDKQVNIGRNDVLGPSSSYQSSSISEECGKQKPTKIRGTVNSGARHCRMLRNIAAVKRMWENPDFKMDPTGLVSEMVQERIAKELE